LQPEISHSEQKGNHIVQHQLNNMLRSITKYRLFGVDDVLKLEEALSW